MTLSINGLAKFFMVGIGLLLCTNLICMKADVQPVVEVLGDIMRTHNEEEGTDQLSILVRVLREDGSSCDQRKVFTKRPAVTESVQEGATKKLKKKYIVSIPQKSVEVLTEPARFIALMQECKGDVQKFLLALELTIYPVLKYFFDDGSESAGRGEPLASKEFKLRINHKHTESDLQTTLVLQLLIGKDELVYDFCTLQLRDTDDIVGSPDTIDPRACKYDGNRMLSIIRQRVGYVPQYPLGSPRNETDRNIDGPIGNMPPLFEGQTLVFIEPWLPGGLEGLDPHDTYTAHRALDDHKKKVHLKEHSLICADVAGKFYVPCVDQCVLQTDSEKKVNFLIIGYKPSAQVSLNEGVLLSANCLQSDGQLKPDEGVYQKTDARKVTIGAKTHYFEKWVKIKKGDDLLDQATCFELVKESKKEPTFKFIATKDDVEKECVKADNAGVKSLQNWLAARKDIFGLEDGIVLENKVFN